MALARCDKCGQPEGRGLNFYTVSHLPASHPTNDIICGRPDCKNPAVIWLTDDEQELYDEGERIFGFNTNAVKVRVV